MENKFLILVCLASACGFATACNSISTNFPSTRFESGEVPGHLVWRFASGGGTSQSVVLTDDASSRPPTISEKLGGYIEYPIAKESLGLGDHFEMGLKYGFPGPLLAKVKFQAMGEPASTAKKGNF